MLTLYYTPSTCALASHIALRDAGAEYELKRISFRREEQRSADYLKINPKGRVPSLITEHGVLTETPAMLAYIAQRFPEAALAPLHDLFEFAQLQSFNSYLCSTVHVAHAHGMRGSRWSDDEAAHESMRRKVPESVSGAFRLIEDGMLRGPWVMGERYSVADPYLFTIAQWMEGDGVDVAQFPRIIDHRTRMRERESVATALAQETPAKAS